MSSPIRADHRGKGEARPGQVQVQVSHGPVSRWAWMAERQRGARAQRDAIDRRVAEMRFGDGSREREVGSSRKKSPKAGVKKQERAGQRV